MRALILKIMILISLSGLMGSKSSRDPCTWSNKKIDKWFTKRDWRNGWSVLPDASINRKALAVSYFKNRERWDKAFNFLKKQ